MSLLAYDDTIKEGFVKIKKSFISLGELGIWRKQWLCLRKASSLGPPRLEIIKHKKKEYDDDLGRIVNSINLVGVLTVTVVPPDQKKNAFKITFVENSMKVFLSFNSSEELKEWQALIIEYSITSSESRKCSFNVYILNNPSLNFYGECFLQVTQNSLLLTQADDLTKRLSLWPLNSLRRFNSDDNKFIFESGRSCNTGEGLFVFNTKEGSLICQRIQEVSCELARNRPQSINTLQNPPVPSRLSRSCRSQRVVPPPLPQPRVPTSSVP